MSKAELFLVLYRLARTAGYSVIQSLRFALYKQRLPDRPEDLKRQMDDHLSRLAELEDEGAISDGVRPRRAVAQ